MIRLIIEHTGREFIAWETGNDKILASSRSFKAIFEDEALAEWKYQHQGQYEEVISRSALDRKRRNS